MPESPRDEWLESLRSHILTALGLPVVVAALPSCFVHGDCPPLQRETVSLEVADTATSATFEDCPEDIDEVQSLFRANDNWCDVMEATFVRADGDDCTYDVKCWMCCGYGRPYLDERGSPVQAGTMRTHQWIDDSVRPDPKALSERDRLAVGRHWLANARAEHSSVAGFHRFALDLLAHGAPIGLVERAQRAAIQELRHAVESFSLASAYLGEPVGPAPMDLGDRAPIAQSLEQLAAWTVRDGALGETLAAYLAARALADTTDSAVRDVLSTVVKDETDHAQIAWDTLRWALDVGGDPVRRAIAGAFDAVGQPASATERWTPDQRDHGVASPEAETSRAVTCIHGVILPIAKALLESSRREA